MIYGPDLMIHAGVRITRVAPGLTKSAGGWGSSHPCHAISLMARISARNFRMSRLG